MANPADPTFIDPVTVRILIVADGRLRFVENPARANGQFSLSLLIEALGERAGPIVRFSITTAYRQPQQHIRIPATEDSIGEGADHKDFKFTDSLQQTFDEVWFFGDQEVLLDGRRDVKVTTQLINDEPTILNGFMDGAGGVFATGDHLSLGASMSAGLPRVGTMRQWNGTKPGTSGDRNDTTSGKDGDEVDEIPQTLHPRFYGRQGSRNYPHPLLGAPRGTINVLPDHAHEGDCREDQTESELQEYNGQKPVIAADSDNRREAGTLPFHAIGAYDGHLATRGRVVVDSSARHFINFNLHGLAGTPAVSAPGIPTRADRGAYAYEDIKTYYRNIATWLAPPAEQAEMFKRALWEVRWRSRVYGLLAPDSGLIDPTQIDPERDFKIVLRVGKETRAALEQLTSPGFTLLWSIENFKSRTGGDPDIASLYPWVRENQRPGGSNDSDDRGAEQVIDFILGGVMIKFAVKFPRKTSVHNPSGELDIILADGVKFGITAFRKSQTE